MNWVDPLGLKRKKGQPKIFRPRPEFLEPRQGQAVFNTMEEAALDGLSNIFRSSQDENVEKAGMIYQTEEGNFFYDMFSGDDSGVAHTIRGPHEGRAGAFHTHVDKFHPITGIPSTRNYQSWYLSEQDMNTADRYGFPIYLENQLGDIHKYEPARDVVSELHRGRGGEGFRPFGSRQEYSWRFKRIH